MSTLYALLVAVNKYPDPRYELKGCINDLDAFAAYLQSFCKEAGFNYAPLILKNEAAKRDALIAGFDHFQSAGVDDQCLFFFSGHGGRSPAPKEFQHLKADKMSESIVCWDSRLEGGRDLMDKELSWLVWRANEGKNLPFVTITDCCHSGNMRGGKSSYMKIRNISSDGRPLAAQEYLGFADYVKDDEGRMGPRLGRRVHLAAALDSQYAMEIVEDDKHRGAFSYALIEALRDMGHLISFRNLNQRVNLRIQSRLRDQSPQIHATRDEDKDLRFLTGIPAEDSAPFLITHDKLLGWKINAGAMQGIHPGDQKSPTTFEIQGTEEKATVYKSEPNFSLVNGMDGFDTNRAYPATLYQLASPPFKVLPAPGSDMAVIDTLDSMLNNKPGGLFRWNDPTLNNTTFWVHAKDQHLWLTREEEEEPCFPALESFTKNALADFIQRMEIVVKWQMALELQNGARTIGQNDISIELYRVTEPGNTEDTAPVEKVETMESPAIFKYAQSLNPAFQLKLRNNSLRPLWVGLLYLGSDYSVTNEILPKRCLEPNQEVWATDLFENYYYRTIPLQIEQNDRNTIDEYLKIIINTEEFNSDSLCQKGMPPVTTDVLRAYGRLRGKEPVRDWTTRMIALRIER